MSGRGTYRGHIAGALALACALSAASCAGDGDSATTAPATAETAEPDSVDSSPVSTPDTAPETTTTAAGDAALTAPTEPADATIAVPSSEVLDADEVATADQVNEYIADAAAFEQAGADIQFPQGLTFAAGGAPGYSRYVFRENSAGVVPTLVEGPIDDAVRCQDEALPCSYLELKALDDAVRSSAATVPPELRMTPDELTELVGQLDALNAFAEAHRDVNTTCAEGFVSDRIQTPNMGSHFYKPAWINDGFDPSRPEILLYTRADGTLPDGPLGQCEGGRWVGEPVELVGTAFIIPPSILGNDHPETFAGPLDNWHIHYNLCRGNSQGRDTFVPRDECVANGGSFSPALGWMIHAWVDPLHDNQLGVFSMWNSSIVPVTDAETILETREVRGSDFPEGAEQSLITDFLFSGSLTVAPGQPLFFNNVDAVPHTVTAGTPTAPEIDAFDSGLLTPGSNFEVSFDEPGTYALFCALHPDMVATVEVID
jgi:hypothetical protein